MNWEKQKYDKEYNQKPEVKARRKSQYEENRKNPIFVENNKNRCKVWAENNKDKIIKYKKDHKEEISIYEREYRKQYDKRDYVIENHKNFMKLYNQLEHVKEKKSEWMKTNWDKYMKKYTSVFNMSKSQFMNALYGWSNSVKKRDRYTCQECGKPGNIAHHLFPKSKYTQLSLDLENGYTLCEICHKEWHKLIGWK